jgi:[acyl-carrier-protein] S-malonyltransferase
MKRAVVLCPGRGSYGKDCLGSLKGLQSSALDTFDAFRADLGRPTVRQMDAEKDFQSTLHVRGENASILTAGITLADLEQLDPERVEVVGVCGNSMGWYTALAYTRSLSLDDSAALIETLGQYQADNINGGQIVYPMVDGAWRMDPTQVALVEDAVSSIDDLHHSIHLGGQAVLAGTEEALAEACERLPTLELGSHSFPLRLPFHSAFHTPLMGDTAAQAMRDLRGLNWRSPQLPLIDGRGHTWRPRHGDPAALMQYTLLTQVTQTFDLKTCIRTALRTLAPDVFILPGPGSNLGSAIAQTMIDEGWSGLDGRTAFVDRQVSDPVLISMRWPDQRRRVIRP